MTEVSTPPVTSVPASDRERAIAVIVLAFSRDPMARWSYPDPHLYLAHFPNVVRAMGGQGFVHGSADHIDGCTGVALWLPPGVAPDHAALAGTMAGVPERLHAEVSAVVEQMAQFHPAEPHWFLPLIGVDPTCQHRGYGSALLRHALRRCDEDHVPAYLESSNPANIPLYQRHGFDVLGTIQAGSSPPMTAMLRKAR
ncbi:GNAT family N-acetyltransferase [Vineibacter terrae]|uniref:GNAT family N-acetyltransferase n=1 Tax=Vineibacter terrae TaxID=2586908 RepID=UPI002E34D41C|nr:GNAT family N-acetyltransferase [Vineibacter terrae]HEX2884986.1 GNAT family N-acetyltransferase [Vineibacter terrae]